MIVIFNPIAGRRHGHVFRQVLDILAANGISAEVAETHSPGHARLLAREAVCVGASIVVAAGGDGTIAEVAGGLLGSSARLGVIPIGTANVFAHELALPFAPKAVAAALAFGRTRQLWPGLACSSGTQRLFIQMLGVGFDAHIVHRLSLPMKRVLGRSAYVLQSLREVARYPFAPIHLFLDGKETVAHSVIVSKGRLYGGRFLLTPEARAGERGFSVVLFDQAGPGAALMYGAALPFNMLSRAPGVRHLHAREIAFTGIAPAQADGDGVGYTPLGVTDAPASIPLVIG